MKRLENGSNTKLFVPGTAARICTEHFEDEYVYRFGKYITLRDEAVPTIFINTQCKHTSKVCFNIGHCISFIFYILYLF